MHATVRAPYIKLQKRLTAIPNCRIPSSTRHVSRVAQRSPTFMPPVTPHSTRPNPSHNTKNQPTDLHTNPPHSETNYSTKTYLNHNYKTYRRTNTTTDTSSTTPPQTNTPYHSPPTNSLTCIVPSETRTDTYPTHTTTINTNKLRSVSDTMVAMPPQIPTTSTCQALTHAWHQSLNHATLHRLMTIYRNNIIPGLTSSSIDATCPITCSACAHGKCAQLPHPRTSHQHRHVADVISSDSVGPIQSPSRLHHHHILTFLDATTCFTISIPIRSRSEPTTLIPSTLTYIARLHDRTPSRYL